jgi:transcriptional regulator with XRE-family HTH domain
MYKQAAYNLAIGMTVAQLIDEKKVQREKIAEALDISELAIPHIERGGEALSAGGLILLLDIFGMSWDDFLARVKTNLPEAQKQIA